MTKAQLGELGFSMGLDGLDGRKMTKADMIKALEEVRHGQDA